MQNYFNYFTEIEERFQQRRGSLLMLSTLDWALIETWREASLPLEAVLRGINIAFDNHDAKVSRAKGRTRRINGLAWCAQSVIEAVQQLNEAAVGAAPARTSLPESGFEPAPVSAYLRANASLLESAAGEQNLPSVVHEITSRLRELARSMEGHEPMPLEDLDRTLTVLEEKLFAALMTAAPEEKLVIFREQAARELAPYRGRMQSVQIRQVQQQFLQKKLLEAHGLPRLSLFYLSHQ